MKQNKLFIYIISVIIIFLIPLYTVFQNYNLLYNGEEYLFKIKSFIPYDMINGKYLDIKFTENKVKSSKFNDEHFINYYVEIKKDSEGFAYFDNISNKKPNNNYYKTSGYYDEYNKYYVIDTPTKYYINEKKINNLKDNYYNNIDNAYVKVKVKNGNMIIVGLYVNNELYK